MFDIQTQLFESHDIRFGPIDHEKDPEIESKWTHDSEFMRLMEMAPARPMSAAMVRKQYEKLEKQIEEDKNLYHFMIRAKEDDRLIGKATVQWIEWANGNGFLRLGIGAAEDRGSIALSPASQDCSMPSLFSTSCSGRPSPSGNLASTLSWECFSLPRRLRAGSWSPADWWTAPPSVTST